MAVGVDDLALGLVTSAVYDGLKRPIKGFRAANTRRQEIITALERRPGQIPLAQDKKLDGALNDLRSVLANQYGNFTERVETFLREFRSSALPQSIYKFLICGKRAEPVWPAFEMLYNTFCPLPFDGRIFFDALCAAIDAQIAHNLQDPALLEVLREQAEEIRRGISDLGSSLQRVKADQALSAEQFLDARQRIARSIELSNKEIPVETERGTRRIPISRIVIPARLIPTDPKSPESPDSVNAYAETERLIDFRRSLDRAVVLGDPGGGKSTLAQLLCYEMAKRLSLDLATRRGTIDDRDLRLPLKVVIRTFERRQKAAASYTILDYFRDELRTVLDNDGPVTEKFIKEILSTGKAILLFDGLDEVLDVGRRREMTVFIEQFVAVYAACPTLITSRVVGYTDAPMSEDFGAYLLARLNRAEVQNFAEKLIKAIGGKGTDAKDLAERFIFQTESNAADLRQNPLLLGLMVYIFKERGDVPDNRPEIYKACSQLLFLKWDQRRDILFAYPDDFELLDLFGYLAVRIFSDPEVEDIVSEDWLVDQVKTFFTEWYRDRVKASAAARALVSFITGRAWVMCDVGPRVYKFTHRTFMEYFVARRLESESESVSALLQTLYPKIEKAEWDVVNHLALQIAASSGPKAIKAVDGLVALIERASRAPKEELNFLNFVARALEYLPVPEVKYENIANMVMNRAIKLGITEDVSSINVFTALVRSSKRKGVFLNEIMIKLLDNIIVRGSREERRFVKFVLLSASVGEKFHDYWDDGSPENDERRSLLSRIVDPILLRHQKTFFNEAEKNIDDARLYMLMYDTNYYTFWKRYGWPLLFFGSDGLAPSEFNNLRFKVIQPVMRRKAHGEGSPDKETVIKEIAAQAVGPGIEIDLPIPRTLTASREARALLEDAFRRVYHYSDMFGNRSKKLAKDWRDVITLLLVYFEIEELLAPKSFSSSKRSRGNEHRGSSARIKSLSDFMPIQILERIFSGVDDINESRLFSDWTSGKISFVRSSPALLG